MPPGTICRHLEQASNSVMKGERLKTFSIGIEGSPDLAAAQKVSRTGQQGQPTLVPLSLCCPLAGGGLFGHRPLWFHVHGRGGH